MLHSSALGVLSRYRNPAWHLKMVWASIIAGASLETLCRMTSLSFARVAQLSLLLRCIR